MKVTLEILRSFQQGSHKAFEKIFLTYFNKIKFFVYGYIKSEADAEDLTEDLFVNLWMNHASIDLTKSFDAYLHTIARNTALNFLKHKLVKESLPIHYKPSETDFSPEESLIALELAGQIEKRIEEMPEQRRNIYRMSRQEGLKNDEIAKKLNTSKHNVESQLSLALKELRQTVSTILFLCL